MNFVDFLRSSTKSSLLSSQHDAFKHLFNYLVYENRGQTEMKIGSNRVDIYVEDSHHAVEIKTISEMSYQKLYEKIIGVLNAEIQTPDSLWIFFFYKIAQSVPNQPKCKYLLVFIIIDLLVLDLENLQTELIDLVEESKIEVAKKLQIRPALILPLENLIKVEDLERLVEEKDHALQEKDQALQEKDQALQEKDQEIQRLKKELSHFKH
jgi:hypothetical protein